MRCGGTLINSEDNYMETIKLILLVALFLAGSGCSSLFQRRTFIDQMDRQTDGLWIAGKDFRLTAGDSGRAYRSRQEILQRTPHSSFDIKKSKDTSSIRHELEKRLSKLNERDYIDFTRYEDYLKSPSEKVYMLSLSPAQWPEYIAAKKAPLGSREGARNILSGRVPASIQGNQWIPLDDLYVGMDKNMVIDKWGRPHRVEQEQESEDGGERWSFYTAGSIRHVFFDKGLVSSWSGE